MSKKVVWSFAVFTAVIAGSVFVVRAMRTPPESRIFINGNILTMDGNNTIAEAVALRYGRIKAVGGNEEIERYKRKGSIIVDLEGKTLVPGFIDAHSHFPGSGLLTSVGVDLNSPPIGEIENITQLIEVLKKKAAATRKGKKIIGLGYDDTKLEEMRHPTRRDLDKASKEHPIFIAHISGHYAVVNSLGLEMLGFDENTENPDGGTIHRDPETNQLTGVLEENAVNMAYDKGAKFSILEKLTIIKHATRQYASVGVTTAQNGWAEYEIIKPLSTISKLGLMPLRLVLFPRDDVGERIISGELNKDEYNTDMFFVGALKLFADGSIQAYTGYLAEPYHIPHKGDETYRGYPIQTREKLAEIVVKYHSAGLQLAIHGNGDAAIDDIIYAVGKAQEAHPREDTRHIIIHCQMARPGQLDSMKKLGITPSYHAVHPYYWGDRHMDIFMGPERAMRISPQKTTIEKGIRFSTHLDTPVVPMDPLFLVWCSVNRISSGGRVIGADERITPMQALRAVTIDAAWQIFQEENRGSIEPGKFADLVILSDDPLKNPEKIKDIEVLETIVGGKTIYRQ